MCELAYLKTAENCRARKIEFIEKVTILNDYIDLNQMLSRFIYISFEAVLSKVKSKNSDILTNAVMAVPAYAKCRLRLHFFYKQ